MTLGKAIPAIISFNTKGEMKPLYFEIDGVRLKVLQAKICNTLVDQIEYACLVEDNGYEKPLRVCYIARTHTWKQMI